MADMEDFDLLAAYSGQDSEAAFTALAERYIGLVYSAALRQVRDPGEAEEVTQVVFVLLARKARTFRKGVILSAWLLRATRFTCTNFLVSQYRRIRREQQAVQMQNDSADDSFWEQIAPLLDEAMSRLGEKDRNVLALRFFEQKSLEEVGVALGIDTGAAQKRVWRTVDKLRQYFSRHGAAFSAATIATALSTHAIHGVPSGLAATVAATAALKGAAASTSTATLIKTTLKLMAWTKLKITAVAVVGVLLAGGTATFMVQHFHPFEPEYQGKNLTYWLASIRNNQLQFLNLRPKPGQPAAEAFQSMGAKAVPFLRRELRSMDLSRRKHAADAAHAIGPAAKELESDLLASAVTTANSNHDPYSEIWALAAMGPESIGLLTNMFTNQNKWARQRTCDALYMADYDAEPAVPALMQSLEDVDPDVRGEAAQALGHVHKQLDVVLPALLKNLNDPVASVRWVTADALGLLGSDAKSAFPVLLEAWRKEPDSTVRPFAAGALKKIDPEAAAMAGVK